ncbi:hypothetical protein [Lactiplantibacillus daowaiensis]|uniref:Uncharacterized protein n=1 Tax=Lactiplantibacillus daowaiensis TaxID=2559918 RepID=A0ABW1RX72_9LACO|nr:hypothetical protein [Lactiplantibacillus daowaiensis]
MTELTDAQIKVAAQVGIDAYRSKVKKYQKSAYERKLRNTKLILENYRYLEDHVNVGLPKLNTDDQAATAAIPKWELSVYALIGYQSRSKLMIRYIDLVLKQYEEDCINSADELRKRRYREIKALFLNKKTINRDRCAELFGVDHRTINRDIQAVTHDLSILLWGADAINDMSMMS